MPRRRCPRSNHDRPGSPTGSCSCSYGAATGQKTAKECRDEWRANKAANQANGITEKAYVAQCRGGAAPAQTTTAPPPPAPAPAPQRRCSCSGTNGSRSSVQTGSSARPSRTRLAPSVRKIRSGRTNFQPKHRLRPAAPPIPLCGSL